MAQDQRIDYKRRINGCLRKVREIVKKELSVAELESLLAVKKKREQELKKEEVRKIKLKKQMGFSEKLILVIIIASWVVILLGALFAFKFVASDIWSYILDTVKWLAAGSFGFFVWKAKSENIIKIKNNPNFDLENYANNLMEELENERENGI